MNCIICGNKIEMMVRSKDDVCCILCEKVKKGELTREQADSYRTNREREASGEAKFT